MSECEGYPDYDDDEEFFTRFDYHSVMGGGGQARRCHAEGKKLKGADEGVTYVAETPAGSVYDLVDWLAEIEGQSHCDRDVFLKKIENQLCGSRGPLPVQFPLMETRRCDMQLDCPYEDMKAPDFMLDEGENCMDHCK